MNNSNSLRLFLASSFADVATVFQDFVNENLQNKTVTFIPTASIVEEYTAHVDRDREAFERLGITVDILELSTAKPEEIQFKLQANDFIFVSGGNTFYLLQEMKRTGADQWIKAEIAKGKIYIGTSAGSVIMSPNIGYLAAMDDFAKAPLLKDYTGLNLIENYPLVHYKNTPFETVTVQIFEEYNHQLSLIPLNNKQVLAIDNKSIKILNSNE
ncbi:Type 1 glutamine amidotransferase-like domain-containing protein [Myroides sp. 1354]|uniref:Type 1 glutamine amidotransferase-like domain-containing protein n=1 Tax=unclassified Myroides TaxID=2642485 RepID=UPI002575056B|nr:MULTISPECIES: Type 1 glutamine amidotransferase-like domain-containing protein [unclassified Myroides]MDM1044760.1 Type 1 glutamine amidotransferase-like domain-containing protein [Myroides sp. R163-1]MDM1055473.1 Type 1 glutamine amidotransferase-like domain-containing protein [Myroides sp. 1354]MDM1068770.1 Type 1 glutamine amidotransferase-like domain-containing protein [Myroides sp. 1372]